MNTSIFQNNFRWIMATGIICLLLACESTYYKTMETMGYHKRDIMVDRVQDARDAQQEAKDQFESALEQFSTVLNFQGGDLEEKYDQLKAEYEASEEKAQAVRLRIDEVEDVAQVAFSAVTVGAIKMVEACIQRQGDGSPCLFGQKALHFVPAGPVSECAAKTDHGNLHTVVQVIAWDGHDSRFPDLWIKAGFAV